jgi:CDP-paratose 2-epimerase
VSVVVVTGSLGLVGSQACAHFAGLGLDVVGIDNDMRGYFFGPEGSTAWNKQLLQRELGSAYKHKDCDVRDAGVIEDIFKRHGASIVLVVHAAAQPSHDWAAREPATDFSVNATGTLVLLEATRRHAPEAPFVFLSTNKVYGDRPNLLPLVELETRWEVEESHPYAAHGIPEEMSLDQCLHSLFGASKAAADLLVQEYGRYFDMPTVCLRAGCITGPQHAGAQLHGFLAYLMKCAAVGRPYSVFGYKGKQVRDNIHAADLVRAVEELWRSPRPGEVYNIGGGRESNCSMLEAIEMAEELAGRPLEWTYDEAARRGDHIWYVSDISKLRSHYPGWSIEYNVPGIMKEIFEQNADRWRNER